MRQLGFVLLHKSFSDYTHLLRVVVGPLASPDGIVPGPASGREVAGLLLAAASSDPLKAAVGLLYR